MSALNQRCVLSRMSPGSELGVKGAGLGLGLGPAIVCSFMVRRIEETLIFASLL